MFSPVKDLARSHSVAPGTEKVYKGSTVFGGCQNCTEMKLHDFLAIFFQVNLLLLSIPQDLLVCHISCNCRGRRKSPCGCNTNAPSRFSLLLYRFPAAATLDKSSRNRPPGCLDQRTPSWLWFWQVTRFTQQGIRSGLLVVAADGAR